MRAFRLFVAIVLVSVAIDIVVGNLWRATVLDCGVAFLLWGLAGTKTRRVTAVIGCMITGFAVGMFGHHPIAGAFLGTIAGVLLWRPMSERRLRTKLIRDR